MLEDEGQRQQRQLLQDQSAASAAGAETRPSGQMVEQEQHERAA